MINLNISLGRSATYGADGVGGQTQPFGGGTELEQQEGPSAVARTGGGVVPPAPAAGSFAGRAAEAWSVADVATTARTRITTAIVTDLGAAISINRSTTTHDAMYCIWCLAVIGSNLVPNVESAN